jgi:hypothetical protein
MSGLEVLGALAAASQLAERGLKIVNSIFKLYSKIRDVPESIRKHSVHVEQLIDIAKLVERNLSLQTASVDPILRHCLGVAQQLQEILSNITAAIGDGKVAKLWKAMGGIAKEK